MKKLSLPIVIFLCIFFFFGIRMIQSKETFSEDVFINNQLYIEAGHDDWLDIQIENAQIYVSVWKESKIEVVPDTLLEQSDIILNKPEKNRIQLSLKNKSKNKNNPIIKIYIPSFIDGICITSNECSFTSLDDLICDVYLTSYKSDVLLKSIIGKIYYKTEYGNLIIDSGKLNGGSIVSIKSGNIRINAIPGIGESEYLTEFGDILYKTPKELDIYTCTIGNVIENYLKDNNKELCNRIINLTSQMGTISITK